MSSPTDGTEVRQGLREDAEDVFLSASFKPPPPLPDLPQEPTIPLPEDGEGGEAEFVGETIIATGELYTGE